MKRPACFQRQTGACRRYGLAVSQPCRGHEEPVGATDLSATDRRTPTDWWRPGAQGALRPSCPADEAINPKRRTIAQRKERSTPTVRRVSSGRSDQLQSLNGCPTGEGLNHSDRRTGPRTKDQRQLRRLCPHCLRRAYHSASAAFPRGRPGESESSSGRTRATGITHPGFYGRKPWKKPNSAVIIDVPRPAKEGLRRPFRRLPPNRSQNLTTNPSHSRPGYRHNRPKLSLFRRSRFLIALRVSKSAV